jgi:transposase
MTYSIDFRKKVVAFVHDGGGQAEAARHFDISLWCVRDWLAREDLRPQQKGVPRQRKLDKDKLRAHVREIPDATIRERAKHFGVHYYAVWEAMHYLKITHQKRRSNTSSAIQKSA